VTPVTCYNTHIQGDGRFYINSDHLCCPDRESIGTQYITINVNKNCCKYATGASSCDCCGGGQDCVCCSPCCGEAIVHINKCCNSVSQLELYKESDSGYTTPLITWSAGGTPGVGTFNFNSCDGNLVLRHKIENSEGLNCPGANCRTCDDLTGENPKWEFFITFPNCDETGQQCSSSSSSSSSSCLRYIPDCCEAAICNPINNGYSIFDIENASYTRTSPADILYNASGYWEIFACPHVCFGILADIDFKDIPITLTDGSEGFIENQIQFEVSFPNTVIKKQGVPTTYGPWVPLQNIVSGATIKGYGKKTFELIFDIGVWLTPVECTGVVFSDTINYARFRPVFKTWTNYDSATPQSKTKQATIQINNLELYECVDLAVCTIDDLCSQNNSSSSTSTSTSSSTNSNSSSSCDGGGTGFLVGSAALFGGPDPNYGDCGRPEQGGGS
jgi:hypothetical protein